MSEKNLLKTHPPSASQQASILFVLPWELHHPGGVNQVVANLFDTCLEAIGLRPLLLVKSWPHRRPEIDLVDGRTTFRLRLRSPLPADTPSAILAFFLELPATLRSLRSLLRTHSVSIVNIHYPSLDTLTWLLLSRKYRFRLVLSFHGADVAEANRSGSLARWLWQVVLARADAVTVCNESLVSPLAELGRPAEQINVIPNGVTPQVIERFAAQSTGLDLPVRYLCALSTFEEKKGLDVLLRAFARIAAAETSLHLVIAGRVAEPHCLQSLEALRDALDLVPRVVFLRNLEHAEAMGVLARSIALAAPSRIEPFGIVILEAGVLRRPVVATSACGAARLLRPDLDLIVVAPDDEAALASALRRILDHPAQAEAMAARLHCEVMTSFTWRRISHVYADAYGVTPPVKGTASHATHEGAETH